MIVLIAWMTGFLVSYVLVRNIARKSDGFHYDWGSVAVVFGMSLLSWIAILIVITVSIISKINRSKPPRWL